MTQKEKELLLKDLCARLLYGVICDRLGIPRKCTEIDIVHGLVYIESVDKDMVPVPFYIEDDTIKPYLRPMSSMTEEERVEYNIIKCSICLEEIDDYAGFTDWLNAHHFDYRGLISMGLALETHEGMYN
jgi:hypothetical protein